MIPLLYPLHPPYATSATGWWGRFHTRRLRRGRVPGFLGLGPAVFGRAQVLFHLPQFFLQGRQLGVAAPIPVERRVGDGVAEVFLFGLQLFDFD